MYEPLSAYVGDTARVTRLPIAMSRIARLLLLAINEGAASGESQNALSLAQDRVVALPTKLREQADRWLAEAMDTLRANTPAQAEESTDPEPDTPVVAAGQAAVWVQAAAEALQWDLSGEQAAAARTILSVLFEQTRATEASLSGYAGTGKTVLLRLIAYVHAIIRKMPVLVLAPTGKAASRLREVFRTTDALADIQITTIHSALYGRPALLGSCPACHEWTREIMEAQEESGEHRCPACSNSFAVGVPIESRIAFSKPKDLCEPYTLVLVDEGSMVSQAVGKHLREKIGEAHGAKLLVAGDAGQLEPVASEGGAIVDLTRATATLVQLHRQREHNPVARLSVRLRHPITAHPWTLPEIQSLFGDRGLESVRVHRRPRQEATTTALAAQWLIDQLRAGRTSTLLAYSNKTRAACNAAVRRLAGFPEPGSPLPQFTGVYPPVLQHERLLILANNHICELMNGEVFRVADVSWVPLPDVFRKWIPVGDVIQVRLHGRPMPVYMFTDTFDNGQPLDTLGNVYRMRLGRLGRMVESAFTQWKVAARASRVPEVLALLEQGEAGREELYDMFLADYGDLLPERFVWATWGYCLTVHKSQGSQWAAVGIMWDYVMARASLEPRGHKLIYTAVSRAEQSVDFFASVG